MMITTIHPLFNSRTLRTVLIALIGFLPSKGEGAIAALDCSADERKRLAKL